MPPPKSRNINLPSVQNSNLPFDPRITTYQPVGTPDRNGSVNDREVDVLRGFIRTDPSKLDGLNRKVQNRYLFFLYNPSTISTSYAVETSPAATAAVADAMSGSRQGEADILSAGLQQSLDFALLFDRTFEVMGGDKEGAWRDVRAALSLVGVLDPVASSGGDIYSVTDALITGPMVMRACFFHFGNQKGGLTYYGYPTSLSIEYTHFSKDMVPIRVGMRISAMMFPSNVNLFEPTSVTSGPNRAPNNRSPYNQLYNYIRPPLSEEDLLADNLQRQSEFWREHGPVVWNN